MLEESKTDADGHVVDAQRHRVALFGGILSEDKAKSLESANENTKLTLRSDTKKVFIVSS